MRDKCSKNSRTLDLYVRLCEGQIINKAEEAVRFNVDERSVQRDIDDIRAFLDERQVRSSSDQRHVVYSRNKKGFVLDGVEGSLMTNGEILSTSKILLESRAFPKKEISSILDKMIAGCVPQKNIKLVVDLIANEKYHYVELQQKPCFQDKIWELGCNIKQCERLEIVYEKQEKDRDLVKRIIEPVAILFSEYYFYMNAYIVEKQKNGNYHPLYEYPTVFRVDRIKSYRKLGEKFKHAYANRFEEGEFRKRVQFMYGGELIKLQFRYTGVSIRAILDRLPTAKIIGEEDDGYVVEAEVFGRGILMWLLSQGNHVEVLRPVALREDMKRLLVEMLGKY